MGLGSKKIKTEMTGKGGGRWIRRATAKLASRKGRRAQSATLERQARKPGFTRF